MDRQNEFFRKGFLDFPDETADTATPRDRIGKVLRDRNFAEEDGIFQRDAAQSTPANAAPSPNKLLAKIGNYALAVSQAASFLDTHPNDTSVLRYYNTYRTLLDESIREYGSLDIHSDL